MDIKKGITFIAFGALFTLVNVNLNFGSGPVNVTPDFIGWVMYYMSFRLLGSYTDRKPWLRILPFVLVLISGARWVLGFTSSYDNVIAILSTVNGVLSAVYLYLLYEVLIVIARNYGSPRKGTLEILRIVNPLLYAVMSAIGFLIVLDDDPTPYVTIFTMVGITGEIAAIWSCIILFGMRNDIAEI